MQCAQCEVSHSVVIKPYVVRDAHLIPLFKCLFAIEALATLAGMALTFAVFLYRKHLKVHVNLRRIMINTALHYTILAPSRLVTMVLMMDWGSNGRIFTAS